MALAELLSKYRRQIFDYLYTSDFQWRAMIKFFKEREQQQKPINAEKPWAFLISCGYALGKEQGIKKLTFQLTNSDQPQPTHTKIWFEAQPIGPRQWKSEKNTRVDLALGAIKRRSGTDSGVELDNRQPPWICFCEAKWNRDISPNVCHDPTRNQLARDLENALCFQAKDSFPSKVYFTVITPKNFGRKGTNSQLAKKYADYQKSEELLRDLEICTLPKNSQLEWHYPADIGQRISNSLQLKWVFYEDLLTNLLETPITAQLTNAWQKEML